MIRVNILKNWHSPDLLQQTPGNTGRWKNAEFFLNANQPSDYVVVLNHPQQDVTVICPPRNIWGVIQEPPTEFNKLIHRGDPSYARVFTTDDELKGKKYLHSQPALPWHINRSYDYLKLVDVPRKTGNISWVTSNLTAIQGHRERMAFLGSIRNKLEFDLFGRGFHPVDDKWQAVAPYRYSIAVENYSNPFYWSEKIADCFLAWTMPIYHGCTRITDYFPPEAMVLIDIHHPDEALEHIREAVQSQRWNKNLDAIRFAREQVLEHYQLFPFILERIEQDTPPPSFWFNKKAQPVFIPENPRIPRFFAENVHAVFSSSRELGKRIYQKIKALR